MTSPFRAGDRVVYTEEQVPYEGYDILSDIMTVYECTLFPEHNEECGRWRVYVEPPKKNKDDYRSWDYADNLRLLTPLEEAML